MLQDLLDELEKFEPSYPEDEEYPDEYEDYPDVELEDLPDYGFDPDPFNEFPNGSDDYDEEVFWFNSEYKEDLIEEGYKEPSWFPKNRLNNRSSRRASKIFTSYCKDMY